MNENSITINELATKMVDELRRIGYSEETIWRNYHPKIRMVVNYYERAGITYYSLKSTDEMLKLYEERCKRGEITNHYLRQMRSIALRMNDFFVTGTLRILASKHGPCTKSVRIMRILLIGLLLKRNIKKIQVMMSDGL